MDKKNTIIGVVVVVIVLAIIGWASGWFGGQAPQDAMAPATTTEPPAAPATTTDDPRPDRPRQPRHAPVRLLEIRCDHEP